MNELKNLKSMMTNLTVGKTYLINHTRKGTFVGKLKSVSDNGDWADIQITGGTANAMLDENIGYIGDTITCRISFCRFTEQP